MNISLPITLGISTQAVEGYVQLEQEKWKPTDNTMSKAELVDFMGAVLYGDGTDVFICKVDEDFKFEKDVYAYPSPSNLSYTTGMSYGRTRRGIRERIQIVEALSFSLAKTQELSFPPSGHVTVRPIPSSPKFRNVEGETIRTPKITVANKTVRLSEKAYGTVEATYYTYRHTHTLTIPVREEAIENRFQSVMYARWDGGVNLEVIETPTNADADYEANWDCNTRFLGGDTDVTGESGGYDPPTASPVETKDVVDYCSQIVVSSS